MAKSTLDEFILLQQRKGEGAEGWIVTSEGGIETCLIYEHKIDLGEHFCALLALRGGVEGGRNALLSAYGAYLRLALERGVDCMLLGAPTWRGSPGWAGKVGVTREELEALNRRAMELAMEIKRQALSRSMKVITAPEIGPQSDGYNPSSFLTVDEARAYHKVQLGWLKAAGADMAQCLTMSYPEEAAGIALACKDLGLPVSISFTVETDGRLPSGCTLDEAIAKVDTVSGSYPAWFGVNCAHPTHVFPALAEGVKEGKPFARRLGAFRCNASKKSHAELDECTELDPGDPVEFGIECFRLKEALPWVCVWGGCCGTSPRHVGQILSRMGREMEE